MTIRTVLMNLDFEAPRGAFEAWAARRLRVAPGDWIAIDAKAIRSTVSDYDSAYQDFVCLVSAFACQSGAVLAQQSYHNKETSEITAARTLLADLMRGGDGGLKGVTFTLGLIGYFLGAQDGGRFDVKSRESTGGYIANSDELIVSPRDVGNTVTGLMARDHKVIQGGILAAYGLFNVPTPLPRSVEAALSAVVGGSTVTLPGQVRSAAQTAMFIQEDPVTINAISYGLNTY